MKAHSWLAASLCLTIAAGAAPAARSTSSSGLADQGVNAPELLMDQGKRLFDQYAYDQAIPTFDRLIAALAPGGGAPIQKPDLLAQAYELRGRAKFATGDTNGAEADFSSLLTVKPDYQMGANVSPRVRTLFENVRKVTVGQATISLTPAGDADIDGRVYALTPNPQTLGFSVGDHTIKVTRPGYRPIEERFTITGGGNTPVAYTLDRVSATLAVISIPDNVEVILDGTSRGKTKKGGGPQSAPLLITDLQPGSHRLQLKRDCYRDIDRNITIERPSDVETEPLTLTQATATVKFQTSEPGSTLYLDGAAQGPVPGQLTVCEGPHSIEVRGAKGRFVDRRDWKTGDSATLSAKLRPAFPIVSVKAPTPQDADRLKTSIERALAPATRVLVYAPTDAELQAAMQGENVPADWLAVDSSGAAASQRVPREVKRDLGRRLATKLQTQGIATISAGTDPYLITVSLLASGSGEPDNITVNLADTAAQTRVIDMLGTALPPLVRPSIETTVVDLSGVVGATVVRAAGSGAKAGLAPGDIIVGAGGTPVGSVLALREKLATVKPPTVNIPLDVKSATGAAKSVTVSITMAPDTMPLRDPQISYNRAFLELTDLVKSAATAGEKAAAYVNLAIVDMRLGNYDEAIVNLRDSNLPDGPGVSAGTVAYLNGLCLEALGRTADARSSFVRAAASPQARLSYDGPLVAPLAQQKLR